jgi:hypothetical protein
MVRLSLQTIRSWAFQVTPYQRLFIDNKVVIELKSHLNSDISARLHPDPDTFSQGCMTLK